MHGNDIAVCGNRRIVRVDLGNPSRTNHILQPVRIRPRRMPVGAVVDDESVFAALGVDPRDGKRHLVDLHTSAVGNRTKDKGSVRHHTECAAVIVGRADNRTVDLRHTEDLPVQRKIGRIDRRRRIGVMCNGTHGLPPGDDAAGKRRTDAVLRRICLDKIRGHLPILILVDIGAQHQPCGDRFLFQNREFRLFRLCASRRRDRRFCRR